MCPISGDRAFGLARSALDRAPGSTYWKCRILKERLSMSFSYTIEIELEDDGRWIAEIPELPGVMVYGQTQAEAVSRVEALALRVIADRIEEAGNCSAAMAVPFAAAA